MENSGKMFSDAHSVPNGLSRWRLEGVFMDCKYLLKKIASFLGEIVCNLNHDRFK